MTNSEGNRGHGVCAPVVTHTLRDIMDGYDALPPAYRRLVRDAAYNIGVEDLTTCSLFALRGALAVVQRQSVLDTYGPDHPQSGK